MANRFWVGGTGTWDASSTTNWSTTTGGAGGASVPNTADFAVFNALSGGGTVTIAYTPVVFGFQVSGYAGTIDFAGYVVKTGGNASTIFAQDTATSWAGTPIVELTYTGVTGTRTISAVSGANEAKAVSFRILGGTDTIATGSGRSLKNLDFTGFAGTLTNTTRNIYGSLTLTAGMTLTAGANATTFAATSGTNTVTTNNKTLDFPLTFNGIGGTFAFQDALTQGSTRAFTITNGTVQLKAGVTSTVGSLTTSTTNQKFLQSSLAGTKATLSQTTGIVSTGYLTIKDINATGGATFNAYTVNSNVNAGNNLGWDFFAQLGKTIFTRRKEKRVLI
jgi:hypothetical protein